MVRVAVLGTTGMLGSVLATWLRHENFDITEFNRQGISYYQNNPSEKLFINENLDLKALDVLSKFDVVINAIGVIRQIIDETSKVDEIQAHLVNSYFPLLLNEFSRKKSIPVIQIGTDCVFSGTVGAYTEKSNFEFTDLYSFTKIVGEELSQSLILIRTSIIGREVSSDHSLLNWVLSRDSRQEIKGFEDHFWNGVTTLHFARIVAGMIKKDNFFNGVQHLVPADVVSKFELVSLIAGAFDRQDIEITKHETRMRVDRSLKTIHEARNKKLWFDAGYPEIPSVAKMISEYAEWERNRGE
jgi:dTDP-4-dehydrorhamnose reductase